MCHYCLGIMLISLEETSQIYLYFTKGIATLRSSISCCGVGRLQKVHSLAMLGNSELGSKRRHDCHKAVSFTCTKERRPDSCPKLCLLEGSLSHCLNTLLWSFTCWFLLRGWLPLTPVRFLSNLPGLQLYLQNALLHFNI